MLSFYNSHSAYWAATAWLSDPSGPVFNTYRAKVGLAASIGQIYIIDLDGNIRFARIGGIGTTSTITNVIDELI